VRTGAGGVSRGHGKLKPAPLGRERRAQHSSAQDLPAALRRRQPAAAANPQPPPTRSTLKEPRGISGARQRLKSWMKRSPLPPPPPPLQPQGTPAFTAQERGGGGGGGGGGGKALFAIANASRACKLTKGRPSPPTIPARRRRPSSKQQPSGRGGGGGGGRGRGGGGGGGLGGLYLRLARHYLSRH
jgi:translation initiation factor IF-2